MHEEAGGQLAVADRSSSTTFVTRPSDLAASARLLTTLQLGFEFWTKKKIIQGSVSGGPAYPGLIEGTARFGPEFPSLSHCVRCSSSVAKPGNLGFSVFLSDQERGSVALIQEPLPSWA